MALWDYLFSKKADSSIYAFRWSWDACGGFLVVLWAIIMRY